MEQITPLLAQNWQVIAVEVEHIGLVVDSRGDVSLCEQAALGDHDIGQGDGGAVQRHEVDLSVNGHAQLMGEGERFVVAQGCLVQENGDVVVAQRARVAGDTGAKQVGQLDLGMSTEHSPERLDSGVPVSPTPGGGCVRHRLIIPSWRNTGPCLAWRRPRIAQPLMGVSRAAATPTWTCVSRPGLARHARAGLVL